MAEQASPSSSSSYHPYPGSSGSSDNDSNSNQEDSRQPANIFRNDGSFMEIFKKMQQRGQVGIKKEESDSKSSEEGSATAASPAKEGGDATPAKEQLPLTSTKKPIISLVGKRRGGRVLATGMVKKQRKQPVPEKLPEGGKTDAWSEYMNEVRKYREQSCEEEGKRRPLVK